MRPVDKILRPLVIIVIIIINIIVVINWHSNY